MKLWNRIKLGSIFFRLVKDPNRTDLIIKGVDIVSHDPDHAPIAIIEKKIMADDAFRKMYESKVTPVTPTNAELARFPEGSFGRALFEHLDRNGLSLEIFPRVQTRRPIDYLSDRAYQDHDLWHVLLGYGIDVEDELAIQAFGVAQYHSPFGALIIAGGLLHLLGRSPLRAVAAVGKVAEGYERGRRAPFLLGIDLHELLPLPLDEARERCALRGNIATTRLSDASA